MRAIGLVLVTALAGLWAYYGLAVAPTRLEPAVALAAVRPADGQVDAVTLNNEGVRLSWRGESADARAYFERAHDFRPHDTTIAANLAAERARLERRAWQRALAPATTLVVVVLVVGSFLGLARRARDRHLLARLRVSGDRWLRVEPQATDAELALRFSEPVRRSLLRRHPLTIVWSSSAHGKHMKSRPPVVLHGDRASVRLGRERLDRLRCYPGDWKGFLYLGRTHVGEAVARVA